MAEVDDLFRHATRQAQAGQHAEAERLLRQLVALAPTHAPALHQLGVLAYHTGRAAQAADWFRQAVTVNPHEPTYLSALGAACQALGQLDEAERWHRRALEVKPGDPLALNNLGITLAALGRNEEAAALFRQALEAEPNDAAALCNLGAVLRSLGRLDEAAGCYRQALQAQPKLAQAHHNLGNVLQDQGHWQEAEGCYQQALAHWPQFTPAAVSWGRLLHLRGRHQQAIELLRQALQRRPGDVPAHLALAVALLALNRAGEAREVCRRALALDVRSAEGYTELGNAHYALGELDEARAAYEQALRLNPTLAPARYDLGLALQASGRLVEARACFAESLRLRPDDHVAHSTLVGALLYDPEVTPQQLDQDHRAWAARHAPAIDDMPVSLGPELSRRLRVGYVSPDLRSHAVSYFLAPVLAHHDRQRVEVFCYAEVPAPDVTTARLRGLADAWRDTPGLTDDELAVRIRADGIDVLVDLAGHTAGNRLRVFARRPAPVQVSWLGYPCTTGLAAIGYRLADAVTDPETEPVGGVEQVVRLPGCFCCYEPPAEVAQSPDLPSDRTGVVTFGSLHKLEKLNDQVLEVWARLLQAVPNARLLVCRHTLHGSAAGELLSRLQRRGVEAARVELRRVQAVDRAHLRIYDAIDVALDAWPWNGHTTACEALWMGVPVVALRGGHHAARMTASVLTCLGLQDLIADTPDGYVQIATALAADRSRRAQLRQGLREQMQGSPLCDGARFTRGLEEALQRLAGPG